MLTGGDQPVSASGEFRIDLARRELQGLGSPSRSAGAPSSSKYSFRRPANRWICGRPVSMWHSGDSTMIKSILSNPLGALVINPARMTDATNGRKGAWAGVAESRSEQPLWVDSALTGAASGRTGVRAKAAIPLRARNRLHRRRGEGRHLTADRRAQSFDDSLALNGQRYLPHLRSQPPSLRDARSCSDDRRPERGRLSTSHALRIYSECRVV